MVGTNEADYDQAHFACMYIMLCIYEDNVNMYTAIHGYGSVAYPACKDIVFFLKHSSSFFPKSIKLHEQIRVSFKHNMSKNGRFVLLVFF